MKTTGFFRFLGPGRISIAIRDPRNHEITTGLKRYPALNPRSPMLKMGLEEYTIHYNTILARLDPQQVWDELHALVTPYEPILLCWEDGLTPEDWCHRRMAAHWIEEKLGVQVPEMELDRKFTRNGFSAHVNEMLRTQRYIHDPELNEIAAAAAEAQE